VEVDRNGLADGSSEWTVICLEPHQGFFEFVESTDAPSFEGADESEHAHAMMGVFSIKDGQTLSVRKSSLAKGVD